jgi:hypothetical protein
MPVCSPTNTVPDDTRYSPGVGYLLYLFNLSFLLEIVWLFRKFIYVLLLEVSRILPIFMLSFLLLKLLLWSWGMEDWEEF